MRPFPALLVLANLLPLAAVAQTPPAVDAASLPATAIPRIEAPITIDGIADEAAWAQASELSLDYEISPGDNIAPPARTRVRIAHSPEALYVSFIADDPDPARIRATLRDRDGMFNDDFVGFMLDTFDDQRRAYEFFVNPLGVQADLIKDEASGNEDALWDGMWQSAGRLTETGYEVEMRIPLSTLRFAPGADTKRWRILFFRNYPRDQRHQISSVPVPRGGRCFTCTFGRFEGLAGVQPGRNIEVVPGLTVSSGQQRAGAGQPWRGSGTDINASLDVAWAPTADTTINLTINPDYSQVESDQAQLDLNSSFALFLPERRPFFLEGADYFQTPFFDVLYTRQINSPDVGLRITGRTDNAAYGAIVARDASTQLLLPGVMGSSFTQLDQAANVAVGRWRQNLNAETTLGFIGTARQGDGYHNHVAGADLRWLRGAHSITAQALRSDSRYPDALGLADAEPSGNAFFGQYRFSNRNWMFQSWHRQVDHGFRTDLGFTNMVGYRQSLLGGQRTWFRDGRTIHRIALYADWDITHRFDGQLLERELEAQLSLQGPYRSQLSISPLSRSRWWNGSMFDEDQVHVQLSGWPMAGLNMSVAARVGTQLDLLASRMGDVRNIGVYAAMDIGRSVDLTVDLLRQQLERDGGTAFTADRMDVRLGWQLDPRQRLRLAVQGRNVRRDPGLYQRPVNARSRDAATQLVYSWRANPRTAFYAGVSWGGYSDDMQPELLGNSRGLFLKYTHAWQPGGN